MFKTKPNIRGQLAKLANLCEPDGFVAKTNWPTGQLARFKRLNSTTKRVVRRPNENSYKVQAQPHSARLPYYVKYHIHTHLYQRIIYFGLYSRSQSNFVRCVSLAATSSFERLRWLKIVKFLPTHSNVLCAYFGSVRFDSVRNSFNIRRLAATATATGNVESK